MRKRPYYSARTGKSPYSGKLDLLLLRRLFGDIYGRFSEKEYFEEAFGYYRLGTQGAAGKLGRDIEAHILRATGKPDLWPIEERHKSYSEDDLFDVIEFLYDCVSERDRRSPLTSYSTYRGRQAFRDEINSLLCDYGDGYELSEDGEILSLGAKEMRPLLEQELSEYDPENVDSRVEAAVRKFRHHTASAEDKREAVRQLADVFEFLRPKLKRVLPSKDEGDLFNIANNFAIRHHNPAQKTQYDEGIWLDWIFYCYLNTIHVSVNLLKRAEESSQ